MQYIWIIAINFSRTESGSLEWKNKSISGFWTYYLLSYNNASFYKKKMLRRTVTIFPGGTAIDFPANGIPPMVSPNVKASLRIRTATSLFKLVGLLKSGCSMIFKIDFRVPPWFGFDEPTRAWTFPKFVIWYVQWAADTILVGDIIVAPQKYLESYSSATCHLKRSIWPTWPPIMRGE